MSISKCMVCQKYRRPVRNYRNLFPADCIGCGTQDWQQQVNSTEKWQEICLTPHKFARRDSNTPNSKQPESSLIKEQTQYLQIGYRPSKQHWSTKAFHIFGNIIRRKNSAATSSCSDQSQELSEASSECGKTTQNPSRVELPTESDTETQVSGEKYRTASASSISEKDLSSNCDQESKILLIGRVNKSFDEPEVTESGVDVLTLMQYRYSENCAVVSVPVSDQTLSLKCCCSDADLTKPSMCGDRACVSCSVHDHRLIARQVSMAAEAAAHAAASVLAVPHVPADPHDVQDLSYTSVTTTPANADIHDVLHSVRSALEHRQRRFRPEPTAHTSVPSQTICVQHSEVATCTTPPTNDATVTPILLSLSKMYHKHLYISALLHNLTSTDVKKLGCRVDECRTKIEALEDVCKQQKMAPVTADMAVGNEEAKIRVDAGVGEGEIFEEKRRPVTVDTAVGEEEIRDVVDKETQDFVEIIDKVDGCTEPTNFGVDTGVQVAGDEGLGVTGVAEMGVQAGEEGFGVNNGIVESVVSEDPWRRISQISDLSSADIHSLNYCNPHLLEAYMLQFENATKTENGLPDITLGSSAEYLHQVTAASASKAPSMSTQKYRLCKPVKVPARPAIRRSPNVAPSPAPGRLRATEDRHTQKNRSPPRQGVVPSVAIQTHPVANSRRSTAASARFAGGRSGMNNLPLRRGLSGNKPMPMKFVSTVRK